MITLLRKIRKGLVAEGRFSSYLLYALGEILLVVLGILIALQINNWNNIKQQQKLERKYLAEIHSNLKLDLMDINFNINFNEDKLSSNQIVLAYLNNEEAYHDSLNFHFSNLLGSTRSVANMSAYENLKSRGLEIVSDDSLRQNITYVYSTAYHNIIDFEKQDDHPHQYEVLWPEVMKTIHVKEMWADGAPINLQKIKKNYPLKNAISTNISFRKHMLGWYKGLLTEVDNLMAEIEKELNI